MTHPSRRIALALGMLIIVAFAIVLAIIAHPSTRAQSPAASSATTTAPSGPSAGIGIPAIHPHLTGSGPSFTAADARAFVTARGGLGHLNPQGPIDVTNVVFGIATHIEATTTHFALQVENARLICYVEFRNTILIANPAGKVVQYTHGYEIFDAHTGNWLGDGAFD